LKKEIYLIILQKKSKKKAAEGDDVKINEDVFLGEEVNKFFFVRFLKVF